MSVAKNEVLRSVRNGLRNHLRVLDSGVIDEPAPNIAVFLQQVLTGHGRRCGLPELRAIEAFEERSGGRPATDPAFSYRLPPEFFRTRESDAFMQRTVMTTANTGSLGATEMGVYWPYLAPFDPVVARAEPIVVTGAGAVFPRGTAQISVLWQTPEATTVAEQTSAVGQHASSPKTCIIFLRASRQLFLQSNANAILRAELARAAAVGMGLAIRQGTGNSGQPTGVLHYAGVTTASGASLAYSGLVDATKAVANANGVRDPGRIAWLAAPDVAGLLKQRYRIATYGDTPLWQGSLHDGEIEGVPAFATNQMPAASAIYGDWSSVNVVEFPMGAVLEVDPFTGFQSGIVAMRLTLNVDVLIPYLGSFYTLTTIS